MGIDRVAPGQRIKAATINSLIETARRVDAQGVPGSGADAVRGGPGTVLCRLHNLDATPIEPYDTLIVRGQPFDASRPEIVLSAGTMSGTDLAEHMVIALDFIQPQGIGRGVVAGLAWAQCDGEHSLRFASPVVGSRRMQLAASGVALVLGFDPGQPTLALVRFPIGGGGGAGGPLLVPHSHQGYYDGGFLNALTGGL